MTAVERARAELIRQANDSTQIGRPWLGIMREGDDPNEIEVDGIIDLEALTRVILGPFA